MTEPSAHDLLVAVLRTHASDRRTDCDAQTGPMPCNYHKPGVSAHIRHCTEPPGHYGPDSPHKDALHCWSFETFTEDDVTGHTPRDLANCTECHSASHPCPIRTEALRMRDQTARRGRPIEGES